MCRMEHTNAGGQMPEVCSKGLAPDFLVTQIFEARLMDFDSMSRFFLCIVTDRHPWLF